MDNGIYVNLSRQLTLFRDMDVTANNIANANTTGYNAEHIMFDTYLTGSKSGKSSDSLAFANDISTYRDTETGSFNVTGNQLDMAISGNGYFAVQTPLGKRYTRAGNFQVDGAGTIVNAEGYPVLDNSGAQIVLPEDTYKVEIGEAGNMKVNGNDFGQIGVYQFDNQQMLERVSGTLFKSELTPQAATSDFRVAQGMLENSNVKAVSELAHMTTLNHAITDTAQFIAVVYDLERKASNAWAQQG